MKPKSKRQNKTGEESRERERQRQRQTDRETDREGDRQTDRQRGRETDRQREGEKVIQMGNSALTRMMPSMVAPWDSKRQMPGSAPPSRVCRAPTDTPRRQKHPWKRVEGGNTLKVGYKKIPHEKA